MKKYKVILTESEMRKLNEVRRNDGIIKLSPIETAYIADRILEDLRGFTDMDGNTDEHSRPELIGIIENAIDDLNEDCIKRNKRKDNE